MNKNGPPFPYYSCRAARKCYTRRKATTMILYSRGIHCFNWMILLSLGSLAETNMQGVQLQGLAFNLERRTSKKTTSSLFKAAYSYLVAYVHHNHRSSQLWTLIIIDFTAPKLFAGFIRDPGSRGNHEWSPSHHSMPYQNSGRWTKR